MEQLEHISNSCAVGAASLETRGVPIFNIQLKLYPRMTLQSPTLEGGKIYEVSFHD